MKIEPLEIKDVLLIEPKRFYDDRGLFFESFNHRQFVEKTGLNVDFVQDNHSFSRKGVLRGLHYQLKHPQGKLVRVVNGEVYDVAVDLRRNSKTCGQWVGVFLSAENARQLWIPEGFAHGFIALSDDVDFLYKTTDYWHGEDERCIIWDDPELNIDWHYKGAPILSDKDKQGQLYLQAEIFP